MVWTPEGSIPQALQERIEFVRSSPSLAKFVASDSTQNKSLSTLINYLNILQQLKKTPRTGWIDHDVKDPESIADHMYRMSIMAMLTNDTKLDTERCVRIALVHDMAESLVGDITPKHNMPKSEKHYRESSTIDYLTENLIKPFNPAAAKDIKELWLEYENISTPEAQFVKSIDKFEFIIQTLECEQYNRKEMDLSFFMDVRTKIITKEVQEWADAFMDMRLDYWKSTASVEPQTEEKEGMWTPENSIKSDLRVLLDNVKSSPSLQEHSAKPDSIKGLGNLFAFLHILTRLKSTRRTGWVDFGIHEPESIADHMYRMGMICMLTNNHDTLNYSRCVSIAVVHDMAEALVGDITPHDPVSKEEKHRRELAAMEYITQTVLKPFNARAADNILELWNEYEDVSSPEARFVKDIDKFELLVQMVEFEFQHGRDKDLSQFLGVRKAIKTQEVQEWADAVIKVRDDYWNVTA